MEDLLTSSTCAGPRLPETLIPAQRLEAPKLKKFAGHTHKQFLGSEHVRLRKAAATKSDSVFAQILTQNPRIATSANVVSQ